MKKYLDRIIPSVALCLITVALVIGVNNIYIKAVATNTEPVVEETTISEESTLLQEETAVQSLRVDSISNTDVSVNTPVITISGYCNTAFPLTINDNSVTLENDGSFSFDVSLVPGLNVINVSNTDITLTYNVTYNMQVLESVSPSKNMTVEGGMVLEISAKALKGSNVYATINGTTVPMTASDDGSQFISYFGTYTIPSASSKALSLGKITFYGTYEGYTDTKTGTKITVNAYKAEDIKIEQGQGVVVAPEITGDDIVNVLSPNSDHGIGQAQMCVVTADYAETVPSSTADDKSDPRCTPEIKGTIDYVTGSVSYDNTPYYILLSGKKIEQKNASLFNGYIMPTNTISAYKAYVSDGYANAILTMNWKVPFNSEVKEQSYHRGYSGRVFNVNSFTASYIDFTFSYTNAAQGKLEFPDSSVVSYAEWVNIGTNGTTTLRVHLKSTGKFYGYKAYFSNDNRLVLSFNEKPSVSNAVVVLDPGHGGNDPGAIGINGTYESTLNLRISAMVKSNLEAAGIRVVILRTGDSAHSLDERQAMARKAGGDIFVAIHNNSSTSSSLSGTEAYYYRANGQPLAKSIHSCLASAWRGIYSNNATMQNKVVASDGGVRFYPFRVTRIEECPTVLVECGYLSNSIECGKVCDGSVQERLARAIADGIINYFNAQ